MFPLQRFTAMTIHTAVFSVLIMAFQRDMLSPIFELKKLGPKRNEIILVKIFFNYTGELQRMGPTRTIKGGEGRQILILTKRNVKWESYKIRMQNGPLHNHILLTFPSISYGPEKGQFASWLRRFPISYFLLSQTGL